MDIIEVAVAIGLGMTFGSVLTAGLYIMLMKKFYKKLVKWMMKIQEEVSEF